MNTNTALILDVNTIKFENQKAFGVTEANKDDILIAASTVKLGDAMSVHEFGRIGAGETTYLDELLDNVRIMDHGKSGKQLTEVTGLAQQISDSVKPTSAQLFMRRIPLVGDLFSRITGIQRRALARFDSVASQINILTESIDKMSHGYISQNVMLDSMYQKVLSEVRTQGVNIVAAALIITGIENELKRLHAELKQDKSNTLLSVEINNIEYQLSSMKKRRENMIAGQEKSYGDLEMIRIIQQNNLTLVDKFMAIEEMTLPATKRGHIFVDVLEKQNSAVRVTEALDNATNALARRQAELVKDNSIRIARQSHRTVFDISTLDYMSKTIHETIIAVKAVHRESADNHLKLEKRAEMWQQERRERLTSAMEK